MGVALAKTLSQSTKNELPGLEIQKQHSTFPSFQLSMLFCARPRPLHDVVEAVGGIPEEARLQDWVTWGKTNAKEKK